jgi:hypothetical protein
MTVEKKMEVIVVIELPCDTCDGVGHAIGLDNMRFTVAQSSIPPEVTASYPAVVTGFSKKTRYIRDI